MNLSEILTKHKAWIANESGERADLSDANLSGANLSNADLRRANLSNADLSDANLSNADLSGARGLLDPIEYLESKFEWAPDGLVAYKQMGLNYSPRPGWTIEPGQVLSEVVSPLPTNSCGCGVNVATLDWIQLNGDSSKPTWKVLIRHRWLPSVVVPYGTDGKIRAGKIELIEIIKETQP